MRPSAIVRLVAISCGCVSLSTSVRAPGWTPHGFVPPPLRPSRSIISPAKMNVPTFPGSISRRGQETASGCHLVQSSKQTWAEQGLSEAPPQDTGRAQHSRATEKTRAEAISHHAALLALAALVITSRASATQAAATTAEDEEGEGRALSSTEERGAVTVADGLEFRESALASAIAETLAVCVCHPLDTAKARLQSLGTPYASVGQALQGTAREEGVGALYRGLGTVLTIGTPAFILYLWSYEVSKAFLLASGVGHASVSAAYFAAGIMAEAVSCLLYVPVDVIKERLQTQRPPSKDTEGGEEDDPLAYKNTWDAIQNIIAQEGPFGVYKGYTASLLSFGPFSALYFAFYEQFKSAGLGYFELMREEQLPFYFLLISAASAGALASFLTNPLDLVRLRLQVQRGTLAASSPSPSRPYLNLVDALIRVYREEGGLRGLYQGAGARVLFFSPNTMISMATYDTLKAWVHATLSHGAPFSILHY